MTDIELSRRKMLAGLGVIGAASASSGYGTSAFLFDREAFANDRLVAGALDMRVGWEEHYADSSGELEDLEHPVYFAGDENVPADYVGLPDPSDPVLYLHPDDVPVFQDATRVRRFPTGGLGPDADPCEALGDAPDDLAAPLVDFEDVKPGDFGEVTFTFSLCTNPGYVWFTGRLGDASENGVVDGEAEVDHPDVVELLDEIRTAVWYDDCDNVFESAENRVFGGTLRQFLSASSSGFLLDGAPGTDDVDCFQPSPTTHCLGFAWWLPEDADAAVLSDSVTFDLGFYTEQCRHNVVDDGPDDGNGSTDISFVAFCVPEETGGLPDGADVTLTYDETGEDLSSLSWDSGTVPISTVVVKAGRCGTTGQPLTDPSVDGMTNVDAAGASSGQVTACTGDPAGADQCPQAPAPEGERTLVKLEYDGDSFVESSVTGDCRGGPPEKSGGNPSDLTGATRIAPDRR